MRKVGRASAESASLGGRLLISLAINAGSADLTPEPRQDGSC